ncbi:MAG: ParA family protein [Lachnospiraceae bacterium]|nr:ParA family protein [Lachnospiraceae bacterium]
MGAKIIGIATQKGGVGKSTTAIEFSAALAIEHDKKVLLVDFDGQTNSSMYLGIEDPKFTSYELIKDPKLVKKAIVKLDHFDIIPGSANLSLINKEFPEPADVFRLDDALDLVRKSYDYIIIDNGPQRDLQMQMVYVTSDYIVCPTDESEGGIKGIENVYEDVEKLKNAKISMSHAEVIGAILTRFKKSQVLSKSLLDYLKATMGAISENIGVYTTADCTKAGEAKIMKMPIQEYAPYSTVAIDYRTIIDSLLEKMGD